jgi:hypothetical protein
MLIGQGTTAFSKPDLTLFKFNNPAKTKKYVVEFEVDQNANWKYKDTGAGVNESGKKAN